MKRQTTVAVAMSGGVDSSVAAALLVEQGYRVVGFTLKLWDAEDDEHARKVCCTTEMARDAKRCCGVLGIPHYTLDLRGEFQREVVDRFAADYLAGLTPNPCVLCNSRIKWGELWRRAQALGMERLATGHYARIASDPEGGCRLLKGLDPAKDQSYFLWEIPAELLRMTIFPLGELTKSEVRTRARALGLPVADREESQEICFIPRDDYRSWLMRRSPELAAGELAGGMTDSDGNRLGTHPGYPLFTIGQRKRLGLGGGRKFYVTGIDPQTRTVRLGDTSDLECTRFRVGQVNVLTSSGFQDGNGYHVKVRYRDRGVPAAVSAGGARSELVVNTAEPVRAVAPGQSAVVYRGDEVVAGGVIAP